MDFALALIGFIFFGIAGFTIGWAIKNNQLQLERAFSREREKSYTDLDARFKAVASDVLRLNSEDLLRTAQSDFTARGEKFKELTEGVGKSVELLQQRINQFEKERGAQFGSVSESVRQVLDASGKIYDTASSLKSVLSASGAVRGRWGEATLKTILEDSGLTQGIDFVLQETVSGDESALLRPDAVVRVPEDAHLAIDSKASLDGFFRVTEEKDEAKRPQHLKDFVSDLRARVRNLAGKEYQRYIDRKIPYVVMFIPSEPAFRAALEYDETLYREAQAQKVMLASPTTIMPTILLIAHMWRQHRSVTNALKISEEVMELGSRINGFFSVFSDLGTSITHANKRYDAAVDALERKVYPKLDQIKLLGGAIEHDEKSRPAKLGIPRETRKSRSRPAVKRIADGPEEKMDAAR